MAAILEGKFRPGKVASLQAYNSELMPESLAAIFIFYFVLAFGAVVSPGPVSTAIVSQAARQGWRVGPLIALGHASLELLVVLAIAFGLEAMLGNPTLQIAIALLGGGLLLWMGLGTLRAILRGQLRLPRVGGGAKGLSAAHLIRLGILTNVANPFWFAWWISVPPSYLEQSRALGALPLAAFYLGPYQCRFRLGHDSI